jgi:hypothetical protein
MDADKGRPSPARCQLLVLRADALRHQCAAYLPHRCIWLDRRDGLQRARQVLQRARVRRHLAHNQLLQRALRVGHALVLKQLRGVLKD